MKLECAEAEKLNLRTEPITQEVFDRMPALLTAYQVKLLTGWCDYDLAAAVAAGQVTVWERPVRHGRRRAYRKYTKASVGKTVGFRI